MKTCEILKIDTGLECDLPADFISIYEDGSKTYFCKNCYRECKKIANEMKIPYFKNCRIERIKI
jgi:hypothetical protein